MVLGGILSGSTDGQPIVISQTATAGNTIHTATSTSGEIDLVTLFASNTSTSAVALTIEWGTATATQNIILTINPKSGLILITPERGLQIKNGGVVRAFAGTTNVINIVGGVIRASDEETF